MQKAHTQQKQTLNHKKQDAKKQKKKTNDKNAKTQ